MALDTGRLLERALGEAGSARDDLRRARGDLRRYTSKGAKTLARGRIADAEHALDLAVKRVDKYAGKSAVEEARTVPLPLPLPSAKKSAAVSRGEAANEWEVGFNYEGSRRHGNAVMVNFRISKRGGGLVTKSEAAEAIKVLHRGGAISDVRQLGLVIDGVDWKRPGWRRSKDGASKHLESFSGIMQQIFIRDFDLRMGGVKDDDLH